MRTASAYLSKLKAENQGRTYKIQDTNHRVNASTLYRGAAGCGALNPSQIEYPRVCPCTYLGPAKQFDVKRTPKCIIYDGGNAYSNFNILLTSNGLSSVILNSTDQPCPYEEPGVTCINYDGGNAYSNFNTLLTSNGLSSVILNSTEQPCA